MTRRTTLAALVSLAALLGSPPTTRAADPYVVDPTHTSIVFSVSHAGLSYTYGFFRKASGNYELDKQNPANCRFRFVIETDSLDTNNAERDKHLRSDAFFNVQQFPTITFVSTACAPSDRPDGAIVYRVSGDLMMHGVKQPVTLDLQMLGEGEGAFRDHRTGFLCQLELKRTDYGMDNLLENNLVGDAVAVTISFEGQIQQQPPAAPPRTRPR